MERPKPQPGHQDQPRLASGQSVKWKSPGVAIANKKKASTQINNSSGGSFLIIYRFRGRFISIKDTTKTSKIPTTPKADMRCM